MNELMKISYREDIEDVGWKGPISFDRGADGQPVAVWQEFHVPPIPGHISFPGAVRVKGRLESTRGGANYNWLANFPLPSRAPYCPRVHLEFRGEVVVRALGWHESADTCWAPEGHQALSWGGTLVDSPAAVAGKEVIDLSFRKEREKVFASAEQKASKDPCTCFAQGQLRAFYVGYSHLEDFAAEVGLDGESEISSICQHPQSPVVLFNHALFVKGVIGLDNSRLVDVQGAVLLSPDHPFEPLELETGLWLLTHPFPEKEVD